MLMKNSATTLLLMLLLLGSLAGGAKAQLHSANRLRPAGPASAPSNDDPLVVSRDHLQRNRGTLGFSADDLSELVVHSRVESAKSQLTHLYLRQQIDGIDVEGADLVSTVDRDGRILSQGDRLVRGLRQRIETRTPELSADAALLAAASWLGLPAVTSLAIRETPGGVSRKVVFEPSGLSRDAIPAELAFVVTDAGAVRISWNLVIRTLDGRDWWNLFIDAETGEELARENWIARDNYNVYAAPITSPDHGGRSLEVNPADATASPLGWHDANGIPGADFINTRGNNVYAQEDTDANDSGGFRPSGGGSLSFNFSIDLNVHPSAIQSASITNLFYWNNYLHDVLYQYGFDEAAGNFQVDNYGNGGSGGDPVQADAQDGSDIDNAQFGTPPDGFVPRMEMFLWSQTLSATLEVLTPGEIAGFYDVRSGDFSGGTSGLTASVIQALDAANATGPTTTDGCTALSNAGAVSGNIAIVDRGECLFVEKTANVQAAGGVGIIVVNNAGDGLIDMSGSDPSLVIPAIFIGQTDGTTIQAQLGTGVTATLVASAARGSSLDNSIIAHEYGHGLSNRLTGGPANVGCLDNAQPAGMGEGWSDWLALSVTADSSNSAITPRPVGTYVLGQPTTGPGIRNFPYSRDLAASPLTFGDIATINQPHGVGEVWASALWDLYWNLVDQYGFDPDLYAGTGGNNLLMQIVLDAMKLQPCEPTFLDARDALILADSNANSGANQCLIWEAFSRRGMGSSATAASSNTTAVSEAFDEPVACQNECGDSTLQAGEQCDDGGTQFFDGCASNCRNETLLPTFGGTANGGSVTATIDGVSVQITTTAGQSPSDIAAALAAAINGDSQLQALYDIAASQTNQVVVTGGFDSLEIHDSGLFAGAFPVPAFGVAARGLLILALVVSWLGVRQRRTSSPSPLHRPLHLHKGRSEP